MLAESTRQQKHSLTFIDDDTQITDLLSQPELLLGNLHVVISPTVSRIKYHLNRLRNSVNHQKLAYPFVAELDKTTLPHEERDIYQKIDRRQIQLLFVTPQKFATLDFLSLLAHQTVGWVMIDKAHLLLGDFEGGQHYPAVTKALNQFQKKPPLVILSQSLPPVREKHLIEALSVLPDIRFDWHTESHSEAAETVTHQTIRVYPVLTEQQKMKRLLPHLPPKTLFETPQSVETKTLTLLFTRQAKSNQKLLKTLHHNGWTQALPYTSNQTFGEKKSLLQEIQSEDHSIIVASGIIDVPIVSNHDHVKLIYWEPPVNLEHPLTQSRHYSQPSDAVFLYTKEDYQTLINYLGKQEHPEFYGNQLKITALKRFRHWVKSSHCREQTLNAYLQGSRRTSSTPCGKCDRCLKGFPLYRELLEAVFT